MRGSGIPCFGHLVTREGLHKMAAPYVHFIIYIAQLSKEDYTILQIYWAVRPRSPDTSPSCLVLLLHKKWGGLLDTRESYSPTRTFSQDFKI